MNGPSPELSKRVTKAKSKKSTGSGERRDISVRKCSEKAMKGANSRPKEWRRSTRRGSTGSAPRTARQAKKRIRSVKALRIFATGTKRFIDHIVFTLLPPLLKETKLHARLSAWEEAISEEVVA